MSDARDQVYSFINKRGEEMARYGPPVPYGKTVEPGSDDDLYLHGLLDRVGDDRAHAEAEKLREVVKSMRLDLLDPFSPYAIQLTTVIANGIDPYVEHDGELFRKSDGRQVVL